MRIIKGWRVPVQLGRDLQPMSGTGSRSLFASSSVVRPKNHEMQPVVARLKETVRSGFLVPWVVDLWSFLPGTAAVFTCASDDFCTDKWHFATVINICSACPHYCKCCHLAFLESDPLFFKLETPSLIDYLFLLPIPITVELFIFALIQCFPQWDVTHVTCIFKSVWAVNDYSGGFKAESEGQGGWLLFAV